MLESLALLYSRHAPFDHGKWRVSEYLARRIKKRKSTVRTREGFLINVDTSDFLQRSIYIDAEWEPETGGILRRELREQDVFFDVGANIGYFSLMASQFCSQVYAFEPNPVTAEALRENITLNRVSNINIQPVALSDRRATATLHLGNSENCGGASLADVGGRVTNVELIPLDELGLPSPRLIKIDVEGAEFQVLKGATRTLSAKPLIICEVSEFNLKLLGSSKDELFSLLGEHGYRSEIISKVRRSNLDSGTVYFQYDVLFY